MTMMYPSDGPHKSLSGLIYQHLVDVKELYKL